MTGRAQQIMLHIIGCAVFLALPFLFSPESLSLHSYLTNPPTQRDIMAYILLLGVFYLNYYLLIPKLYFPRKYGLFILATMISFALITWLPGTFLHRRPPPNMPPLPFGHAHKPPLDEHIFI